MILLPVSPSVAPANPNWPAQIHQTGYWFARPQQGWQPPQSLLDFLDAGEKPVAISLGVMSVSGKKAEESARLVMDAIRAAGVRAIVQGWEPELIKANGSSTEVYSAGPLPHGWLFDQVAAVIHHGGFGTTAAGLRSGVPGIVIPHIIDQFVWGQTVFNLGVGPKYITRCRLTAENVAAAIHQALTDRQLQARACEIGRKIRSEPDGVTRAVTWIEQAI